MSKHTMSAVPKQSVSGHSTIYTRVFWGAFFAHMVIGTANSLTFRFADLVNHLNGDEKTTGVIVSVGAVSALASRLVLGQALDYFGLRRIWLLTGTCLVAGSAGFLIAKDIFPTLYIARILYAVGLAGGITGTNLYIQNQVADHHRTEAIASMGSAGFLGLMLGPLIGDMIFLFSPSPFQFESLFGTVLALTVVFFVTIYRLSSGEVHLRLQKSLPVIPLFVRYHPCRATLAALAMGMTFAFMQVFLIRFVDSRQLGELSPFYTTYALSAFGFRMVSKHWSSSLGRYHMISLGLLAHALAMASFLMVTRPWMLLIPAVLVGFGFAVLYPSVVSLITESYPTANRGTGTNLALGSIEAGTFLSAPAIGSVIQWMGGDGYDQLFLAAAVLMLGISIIVSFPLQDAHDGNLDRK